MDARHEDVVQLEEIKRQEREKRQVSRETCRFSMKRSLREHDVASLMMSLC